MDEKRGIEGTHERAGIANSYCQKLFDSLDTNEKRNRRDVDESKKEERKGRKVRNDHVIWQPARLKRSRRKKITIERIVWLFPASKKRNNKRKYI